MPHTNPEYYERERRRFEATTGQQWGWRWTHSPIDTAPTDEIAEQIQQHLPYTTLKLDEFTDAMKHGVLDALVETKAKSPTIYKHIRGKIREISALTPEKVVRQAMYPDPEKGFIMGHELPESEFRQQVGILQGDPITYPQIAGLSTSEGHVYLNPRAKYPSATSDIVRDEKGVAAHEMMHQVGYDIHMPFEEMYKSPMPGTINAGLPARSHFFAKRYNELIDTEDAHPLHVHPYQMRNVRSLANPAEPFSVYATTNPSEFMAEGLASGILGRFKSTNPADVGSMYGDKMIKAAEDTLRSGLPSPRAMLKGGFARTPEYRMAKRLAKRTQNARIMKTSVRASRGKLGIRSSAPGASKIAKYAEAAGLKGVWSKARRML